MREKAVEFLCNEHRNMERVLTLISLQISFLTGTRDLRGFTLLSNAISYMHNYPGMSHHPAEELILTKLGVLCPSKAGVCDAVTDQHISFSQNETTMLRHIREAQAGDATACESLKSIGSLYCTEHWDHFFTEENEIFPEALEFLAEDDWCNITAKYMTVADPIFREGGLRYYQSLYDYLMASKIGIDVH